MNCPNCHQALEPGAAFCGNCGQPVAAAPALPAAPAVSGQSSPPPGSPIAQVLQNQQAGATSPQVPAGPLATAGVGGVPSYAVALPGQHSRENKALLSLLFGIAGIIGALFMVALGLALGLVGIVMGTMSRAGSKRSLSTAGLIVSGIAVLGSLALWTYAAKHFAQLSQASTKAHSLTAPAVAASHLSTPCYSTDFADQLNVSNSANSCDMAAFNGTTLETSTNAYKVYANTSQTATAANLALVAKPAIEKDIQTNLPSFTVTGEGAVEFAGSPAYAVNAADKAQGVSIVEAAVFHQVANGENLFILVHAANANSADLHGLETQWQWK
jgi:hypothetical protein